MRSAIAIALVLAAGAASAKDRPAEVCRDVPATWVYFNCKDLYMVCAANMPDGWYWREGARACRPAKAD